MRHTRRGAARSALQPRSPDADSPKRPRRPAPPQWPGVADAVRPPNAGLRLYGGAAFERCLNEFQEAAHALRFPTGGGPLPVQRAGTRSGRLAEGRGVTPAAQSWLLILPLRAPSPPAASVARDRVANVLLARKGRDNLTGAARAAEDIARQVGAGEAAGCLGLDART